MRKNQLLLVIEMEVANHPHFDVYLSENRTNHCHFYFGNVMSFLRILTNSTPATILL